MTHTATIAAGQQLLSQTDRDLITRVRSIGTGGGLPALTDICDLVDRLAAQLAAAPDHVLTAAHMISVYRWADGRNVGYLSGWRCSCGGRDDIGYNVPKVTASRAIQHVPYGQTFTVAGPLDTEPPVWAGGQ